MRGLGRCEQGMAIGRRSPGRRRARLPPAAEELPRDFDRADPVSELREYVRRIASNAYGLTDGDVALRVQRRSEVSLVEDEQIRPLHGDDVFG